MELEELLAVMPECKILKGKIKTQINGLAYDSRCCEDGFIFFCKGKNFKSGYVLDALENGATVFVSGREYIEVVYDVLKHTHITVILVDDIAAAMSQCASHFYGYPIKRLKTVAVTGTKGKTTVSHFISSILNQCTDFKSALLSDMIDDGVSHLTTPESIDFQKAASKALDEGYTHLVCEISSQAQKTGRVQGIEFDVSCFINLGNDHIGSGEHESVEEYFLCKAAIIKKSKVAVINVDWPYGVRLTKMINKGQKIITVSESGKEADYVCQSIAADDKKCEISVLDNIRKDVFVVSTTLLGTHNAINMLCACAVAVELGAGTKESYLGILGVHPSGRSKVLYSNDKRLCIVVDYAHNEMSLTAMSKMAKEQLGAKTVTAVFGCPGDKAQCRRYGLALACQKNVDNVIICEDDSGVEGYENIKKEMTVCFEKAKKAAALENKELRVAYVENRAQALSTAIENALKNEGEVILMLGKGEEALNRGAQGYAPCESDLDIAKRMILCYDSKDNKRI